MRKISIKAAIVLAALGAISATTLFAGQGASRMLYAVPNSTFIENPSGDSVVTINDTSGSVSTLQTLINNARSANPNSIIVIHLLSGATYSVSSAGLVLGSQECLVGTGATILAADSTVTVPLITISLGATNVSVAGGTFNGNGAAIYAIYGGGNNRVNVDKVVAQNCGQDCIQLNGNGDGTFDNELTVTRCDVSDSSGHSGISLWNTTQATCVDNNCHDNSVGIWMGNCAYANIANNTCGNNTTGIDFSSGNDNYIANNTCNNNGTGILLDGSSSMVVSDSIGGNTVAGINSNGSGNIYVDNLFTAGNAANFISGGSGNDVVAYKSSMSASGQNYFYPPLIDNQHTNTIVNGKGRTDITNSATTTIDSVQSQYNAAVSANPNNVIVLHLNGSYTVGANPLTLSSYTCVLLNGTIQIYTNSTTAGEAITAPSGASYISVSGGTIDGGAIIPPPSSESHNGIYFSGIGMFQIDAVTLQNFGNSSSRIGGSDVIQIDHGSTPRIVTRCTVNGSSARGIWLATSGVRDVVSDNTVTDCQMDGVDCDESTSASLVKFNYLYSNTRYGVFVEQSASYNCILGNICNYDSSYGVGCYNNYATYRAPTAYNSVICNSILGGGGLRNGSTGTNTTVSSDNFFFNNTLANTSIHSDLYGTQDYYSQNYLSGTSLSTSASTVLFNSPDVSTNIYVQDSNSRLFAVVTNASTSTGAAVITGPTNTLGSDQWQLVPTDSGYYKIINKNSKLALVVLGASTNAGASIIQWTYNASGNDEWMPVSAGNGLYYFVNRLSGLYLDVPDSSLTAGVQLDQQPPTGGANQQFNINGISLGTPPPFSLSASPASQTVIAGGSTTFTVTVATNSSFSGSVNFGLSGLPANAGASFSAASLSAAGNSTLTVTISNSAPVGNYTLTIYGTNAATVASMTVALTIASPSLIWNGNLSGNWDTSTANWQGGSIYQQGDFARFDDTLAGTTNVNLTTTLSPASIIVSNTAALSSANYTFSGGGSISGATGLTKQGSGALIVDNGGVNNYTGGNVISAGTVQVGNNDANGNLSGSITDNGSLVFDRSDSALNVSNVISGSGTVTQNGGGTVTLSGTSSYTGKTIVSNGGALSISAEANLGGNPASFNASQLYIDGGDLIISAAVTLNNANRGVTLDNTLGGSVEVDSGISATIGNVVTGGTLTKTGGGTLVLNNVGNTFTNAIISDAGTLRINSSPGALGGGTAPVAVQNGSQLYLDAAGAYANSSVNIIGYGVSESDPAATHLGAIRFAIAGAILSGNVVLAGDAGISARGTGTTGATISGQITGPFNIRFGRVSTSSSVSLGTLILSNPNNNWTGNTTNMDGTLKLGAANVIPNGAGFGNLIMATPGAAFVSGIVPTIFDLAGFNQIINGLSHDPGVTGSDLTLLVITNSSATAATLTVGNGDANGNYAGLIKDGNSLGLTKTGSGTETLGGNNTYAGNTTINAGTLALSGSGSISNTATITVVVGATLDASGRSDQTLTLNGGQTLQGGGMINANLTVGLGATVMPGNSSIFGTLTVSGTAQLQGATFMKLNATTETNDQINAGGFNYGGTLVVTNLSGALAAGQSFRLFAGGSYSGSFSATNLPPLGAGLVWSNNLATGGVLQVVSTVQSQPHITGIALSGTNLILNGTNGSDGGTYVLLSSTNLALPLNQWLPVATNNFDGSGNFSLTNGFNPNGPQQFYLLKLQ